MFKLRVRCFSKNSGELFFNYDTKILHDSVVLGTSLYYALSVFQKHLKSDVLEDCTFEATVLRVKEELPIFDDLEEHSDFNNFPVVF